MNDIVKVTRRDGIAEVMLNRPKRKNALSLDMFDAIVAAAEELKEASDIRAVVLYGAGGDFCSGLDMEVMASQAGHIDALREKLKTPLPGRAANWFQAPACVWSELSVPVIAALEGVCLGGGLQIALGADMRIATPDARMSIMEAKWGLIPDMGISQSLPKLMAADQAKRLMMTAEMLSGEQALNYGLITEISATPIETARELAQCIAERSPDAIGGIKRLVDETWVMAPGDGLKVEADIQAPIIGGANQIEAVMANLQKRAPKFKT